MSRKRVLEDECLPSPSSKKMSIIEECGLEYKKELVIRHVIKKYSDFTKERSGKKYISGICWQIEAEKCTDDLRVTLVHNPRVRLSRIKAEFSYTLSIVNQIGLRNLEWTDEKEVHSLTFASHSFGTDSIISLKDLTKAERGHVINDTLILEARINIVREYGVYPELISTIGDKPNALMDLVLQVSDGNVAVCKTYLALVSPLCKRGFFEGADHELQEALDALTRRQLILLLRVVYPERMRVNKENVFDVLEAAGKLDVAIALRLCDDCIDGMLYEVVKDIDIEMFVKLVHIANKYQLPKMQQYISIKLEFAFNTPARYWKPRRSTDGEEEEEGEDRDLIEPHFTLEQMMATNAYEEIMDASSRAYLFEMVEYYAHAKHRDEYSPGHKRVKTFPDGHIEFSMAVHVEHKYQAICGVHGSDIGWELRVEVNDEGEIWGTLLCNPTNFTRSWACTATAFLSIKAEQPDTHENWGPFRTDPVTATSRFPLSRKKPFLKQKITTHDEVAGQNYYPYLFHLEGDHAESTMEGRHYRVTAHITMTDFEGIPAKPVQWEFTDTLTATADVLLEVEGKKIAVNRACLALHSQYFNRLFFGGFKESGQEVVPIKDVSYDDFVLLMKACYPAKCLPDRRDEDAAVYWDKTKRLLKIADYLQLTQIPIWTDNARMCVRSHTEWQHLFPVADAYLLNRTIVGIHKIGNVDRLATLMNTKDYAEEFSDGVKTLMYEMTSAPKGTYDPIF